MEKALFVARSPYGCEVLSMELSLEENLFNQAHKVMEAAKGGTHQEVYSCEIWIRPVPHQMNLLVTVF